MSLNLYKKFLKKYKNWNWGNGDLLYLLIGSIGELKVLISSTDLFLGDGNVFHGFYLE